MHISPSPFYRHHHRRLDDPQPQSSSPENRGQNVKTPALAEKWLSIGPRGHGALRVKIALNETDNGVIDLPGTAS